jgi:hypothetical protein
MTHGGTQPLSIKPSTEPTESDKPDFQRLSAITENSIEQKIMELKKKRASLTLINENGLTPR